MLQTSTQIAPETRFPATEMPRVRRALPEDFDQLMDLGAQLYEENGVSDVDWDIVAQAIAKGISGQGGVIGVIGPVGDIQGVICLQISRMWYSQTPILEELFNFVPERHRRSNNAKAMIDFAKENASRLGVPLLIGIISNERTEEKVRLYRRRLGAPAGAFFLVNAKTGR